MNRTLTAAVLCGLALAGCTSAVRGSGTVARNASAPLARGTGAPCRGAVITASGAPYCYVLPPGMRELKNIALPHGGTFTTAVGLGGWDVIAVTTFMLPSDTDRVGDARLRTETDKLVTKELGGDFTMTTKTGDRLTVDDARALHYHGRSTTNPVDIDFYVVYHRTTRVQVNCQYKDGKAQITAGCTTVLESMRLTN